MSANGEILAGGFVHDLGSLLMSLSRSNIKSTNVCAQVISP